MEQTAPRELKEIREHRDSKAPRASKELKATRALRATADFKDFKVWMEHHEIQVQLEHKAFLVCKVHPDPRDLPVLRVPQDLQRTQVLQAPLDDQV
jgi:hypothetical protein